MPPRVRQNLVSVRLPLPPSVNAAFASRGHSHRTAKTAAYRFWWQQVCDTLGDFDKLPVFRNGRYCLWIDLPKNMKGDSDNRTKLISDVLRAPSVANQAREGLAIVVDDADMRDHMVHMCDGLPNDQCIATVVAEADWPGYVMMRIG